ncbi:MAG: ATP-dependent 6-phosphofructokinase [Elusimicrobia bacterium]|jgi:6-phosphofructokinase 1|nr:ATP-dependent 6-phosphofructokinase [Elusimicrobiota bacterium]
MKPKKIKISKVGTPQIPSSLKNKEWVHFISSENDVVAQLHKKNLLSEIEKGRPEFFELAGPREKIYFNPEELKCGIVTCGGLCPGINDVIRELVIELWQGYGVKQIEGFRYGYRGLAKADEIKPIKINPELVDSIHRDGGTMLSSSRGPQDEDKMIDTLVNRGIGVLFIVGGDGTMKGAHSIAGKIKERGLAISVVGIPKTIDNDISFVKNSFGFETSVQAAADIIDSAHTEAKGAPNCIGLVKLMGRTSGFIASHTALANRNVNYCLLPEVPFKMKGKDGFLQILKERIKRKQHAVIVAAEGAGQDLMRKNMRKKSKKGQKDKSGNEKLKDIGIYLKDELEDFFKKEEIEINIKYFDPSYIIRSIPANAMDSLYCVQLAQNAVHAALSGRTDMLISKWNAHYIHLPIEMVTKGRKKVNSDGRLWRTVMEATGQPYSMFKSKD